MPRSAKERTTRGRAKALVFAAALLCVAPRARAQTEDAARLAPEAAPTATTPVAPSGTTGSGTSSTVASPQAPVAPPPDRAPRYYEIRIAGTSAGRADLPLSNSGAAVRPFGLGIGLRMGWRVGGLHRGSPSWVGFDVGFGDLVAPSARDGLLLSYGIFAAHAFLPSRRVHPFITYGLGAAQIWVIGVSGRAIGHSTRLGAGVTFDVGASRIAGIALVYAGTRMASFASSTSVAKNEGIDQLELDLFFAFEAGVGRGR